MTNDEIQELKKKIALQRSKLPEPKSFWRLQAELSKKVLKNGKA